MESSSADAPILRRAESEVLLSGAGIRHRRAWFPELPSRAMVVVHGYAEHCGRYDEMAAHFVSHGFAVHAYDQAGHGRTPGPRGDVDRFDRLLEELDEFIAFVRESHPGLPISLVGHSMGGLVAAATAAFFGPPVDHLILSGALLELGTETPAWKKMMARLLAPLGARVGLAAGLDPSGLSRDPEVARRYEADPYVEDRMSARFASGMMQMVERMSEAPDRMKQRVLLMHGGDDPMSPPSGSEAFHARLPAAIATKSRLRIYPGLRHEIFNEPEREEIWAEMLDWIEDTT